MTTRPVLGIDARLAAETQRAGVGNFCTEILKALPGAAPDWQLRLYLDHMPDEHFPLSENVADYRVLPRRRFWTHRALGKELRRNPPTVFFSPVMQMPITCPCPSLVTVHDLAFLDYGDHFTRRQRYTARLQASHTVFSATHLCAVSQATSDDLQKHFDVSLERITVTLEGVSPRFQPVVDAARLAALREKYHLPEHFVLYVGRLQPRKNIARLIEAFGHAVTRHPELQHGLVIAGGKGWMYDEIYAAAKANTAHARIHFPGFVDEEDLPALISAADLLALVSLWEGFGLPVLEAMACGTAVLTSNTSSLPEVAGEAAALVDPYDTDAIATALGGLLADDTHRAVLAEAGRQRATQFTWEAAAARLMQAIKTIA